MTRVISMVTQVTHCTVTHCTSRAVHQNNNMNTPGDPIVVQRKWTRQRTMRLQVGSLTWFSELRLWCCCELWYIGHRHSLDPALLWMWLCPAAVAPIWSLAWKPPKSLGEKIKIKKKKKKKEYSSIPDICMADITEKVW